MATRRFAYRLHPRSGLVLRLFGVHGPDDAWVELTDGELVARFGWSLARVPVRDITSWRIEGPWRWITAIGVRRSVRHGDLTFGGSPDGGVRVDVDPRPRVGIFRPPALYLTVDEPEALAAELAARGIPGVDARRDVR